MDEGKNRQILCFKINPMVVLPHLVVLTFEQGSNVRTTFLSWAAGEENYSNLLRFCALRIFGGVPCE